MREKLKKNTEARGNSEGHTKIFQTQEFARQKNNLRPHRDGADGNLKMPAA